MKSFKQYINEDSQRIFPDIAPKKQFGDDTKMKLLGLGVKPPEQNPNAKVDTTGANSPFAYNDIKSYDPNKKIDAPKSQPTSIRSPIDTPPKPPSMQDKLNMMRMKSSVEHERFKNKMNADFQAAQQAYQNKKLATASNEKSPTKSTVKIGDTGVKKVVNKIEPKKEIIPTPKLKPKELKTKTFGQAFADARKSGKKIFWHDGKLYNTKVKK